MKDLVFVKFNSKLREKRESKSRDPIVSNDGDEYIEWLIAIVRKAKTNAEAEEHEQVANVDEDGSSQEVATAQHKRKGGKGNLRFRKKRKLIPILDDEVEEASSTTSSSEDEDDNDTTFLAASSGDDMSLDDDDSD